MHSSWLMCCYFSDKRRIKMTQPFKWWCQKKPKSVCDSSQGSSYSSSCDSTATTIAWGRENSLYSTFI